MTIISAYAPTLQSDVITKETFYKDLKSLLSRVDSADKLLIMGTFNARVGRDHQEYWVTMELVIVKTMGA